MSSASKHTFQQRTDSGQFLFIKQRVTMSGRVMRGPAPAASSATDLRIIWQPKNVFFYALRDLDVS
jgi:hypothetical protein